jgi:methylmalonyl-CoA/ethylmalonyl-CoA epimerase
MKISQELGTNLLHLDHIGIATDDVLKSKSFFELIGMSFSHEEIVASENVKVAFAQIDKNSHLELLQPLSEDGAIYQFLQKKGGGIHHLCFKVKSIKQASLDLDLKGIKFIYPEARNGANNKLVNFIHPKFTGGVLIELSESLESESSIEREQK